MLLAGFLVRAWLGLCTLGKVVEVLQSFVCSVYVFQFRDAALCVDLTFV